MSTDNDPGTTFGVLMHETLNDVSAIMSIAQLCLLTKEMSPEIQADMKRILDTGRKLSDNLKRIAEVLQEEEEEED